MKYQMKAKLIFWQKYDFDGMVHNKEFYNKSSDTKYTSFITSQTAPTWTACSAVTLGMEEAHT